MKQKLCLSLKKRNKSMELVFSNFYRISKRLEQNFMFKALSQEELDIVIAAMAEKRVK